MAKGCFSGNLLLGTCAYRQTLAPANSKLSASTCFGRTNLLPAVLAIQQCRTKFQTRRVQVHNGGQRVRMTSFIKSDVTMVLHAAAPTFAFGVGQYNLKETRRSPLNRPEIRSALITVSCVAHNSAAIATKCSHAGHLQLAGNTMSRPSTAAFDSSCPCCVSAPQESTIPLSGKARGSGVPRLQAEGGSGHDGGSGACSALPSEWHEPFPFPFP